MPSKELSRLLLGASGLITDRPLEMFVTKGVSSRGQGSKAHHARRPSHGGHFASRGACFLVGPPTELGHSTTNPAYRKAFALGPRTRYQQFVSSRSQPILEDLSKGEMVLFSPINSSVMYAHVVSYSIATYYVP